MSWFWEWWAQLSPDSRDVLKTTVGPTVAILLFVLTNIAQIIIAQTQRRREIRRIVTGIYREIAENLDNQRRLSVGLEATMSAIKERLRDDDRTSAAAGKPPTYRPLLGITESSQFYDAIATSLPLVAAAALIAISQYYRRVSDERILVGSIENYAFLCVTINSRCEIIDELLAAFKEAQQRGDAAIAALHRNYPMRWFRA